MGKRKIVGAKIARRLWASIVSVAGWNVRENRFHSLIFGGFLRFLKVSDWFVRWFWMFGGDVYGFVRTIFRFFGIFSGIILDNIVCFQ